jgi:hypothetical protein
MLCAHSRNNNATIQCPVQPGEYEVAHTVLLPKEVPRGSLPSPDASEGAHRLTTLRQPYHSQILGAGPRLHGR